MDEFGHAGGRASQIYPPEPSLTLAGYRPTVLESLGSRFEAVEECLRSGGIHLSRCADESLDEWVKKHQPAVLVTSLGDEELSRLVRRKIIRPTPFLVALMETERVTAAELTAYGFTAGVLTDAPAVVLAMTVHLASTGHVVLPPQVGNSGTPTDDRRCSDHELVWLTMLGHGATIDDVAAHECVSTRQQKRRLSALYVKLRVTGLQEALMLAAGLGWIEAPRQLRDSPRESRFRPADAWHAHRWGRAALPGPKPQARRGASAPGKPPTEN